MEIITSTSDLEKKVKDIIKNAEFVAIDTEFVREKTYYAGLGLIQIGYNGIEFAIYLMKYQTDYLIPKLQQSF